MLKYILKDFSYYRYLYGTCFVLTIIAFAVCIALYPENGVKYFQLLAGASGASAIIVLLITKHNRLGKQNLQIYRTTLSYNSLAIARVMIFIFYWLAVTAVFLLFGAIFKPELVSILQLLDMFKLSCLIIALMASYMIMLDLANLFRQEWAKISFVLTYSLVIYFFNATLVFSFVGEKFDYSRFSLLFGIRDTLDFVFHHELGVLWALLYAVAAYLFSIFTFNLRKSYLIV